MPRDKRKTRLEKQGGEFLGFGAFASGDGAPGDATSSTPPSQQQWSPVYTGSDQQLHLVFRRVAQKRDGVTKAKALGDLREYFEKEDVPKKDQVTALSHLIFLYHSKLGYDGFPSVRAAALECMQAAYERLPKAWKTMVLEQQGGEVWGSLWCLQADSSAEVRSAAVACCQRLQLQDESSPPDHKGVVNYVTRLLGYDRPRNLHDALFARKSTSSSSLSPADSKQTTMSESERDQMEERFDRIVGTALTGMELWIRQHPETDYEGCFQDEILWKTLSSSRSSFRRRTYALLAACCQHAKDLVYSAAERLSKGLTNVLTFEKEPVNIPPLLEVLLLYISKFPDGRPWESLDAKLITKNLGKMLRKACDGATSKEWGPTMLPLLAALPDDSLTLQRQLLSNLWAGHDTAIGTSDAIVVVSSVAECASYFLLRKQSTCIDANVAQELAEYWLKSLDFYLSLEAVSNSARESDRVLLLCLSNGLSQLDVASLNRSQSAIYSIKDAFWSDRLPSHVRNLNGSEVDRRLALLLRETRDHQATQSGARSSDDDVKSSLVKMIAHEIFWTTLRRFQGSSGSIPDKNAYDLMIACLQYSGDASDIFVSQQGDSMAMDQFIMNDLLRWLVVHTSKHPLPGCKGRRATLVTKDFTLLRLCFSSVTAERRQSVWESVVREVVAAECDLRHFSTGLAILAERENDDPSWAQSLQCKPLHDFAAQIGREAVVEHHNYVSRLVHEEIVEDDVENCDHRDEASKTEAFLRACAGLGSHCSFGFIQKPVVDGWISALSEDLEDHVISIGGDTSIENPLLTTLILLCEAKGTLIDAQGKKRLMMITWRHGGRAWIDHSLVWFSGDIESPQEVLQLATDASHELRTMLKTVPSDRVETTLMCHVWSDRAFRLLGLQDLKKQRLFPCPFLESVGLMDVSEWTIASSKEDTLCLDRLYLSLIFLLEQIADTRKRLCLFTENTPTVLVKLLISMSDVSEATLVDPSRREDWRVASIINMFDHENLRATRTLEDWCEEAIAVLESCFSHETNYSMAERSISVLTEILCCMFHPVSLDSDSLEPEDIEEGQTLWYVADSSNDITREKAVIVKIHTDDFPRLYFTIRIEDNGKKEERQTVSSRLRSSPAKRPEERVKEENEKVDRQRISCLLAERLLRPHFVSETNDPGYLNVIAEIVNLVVSQSGLYEKAGIGSIQFDIFRWMSSVESKIVDSLVSNSFSEASTIFLESLTLALGYGHITHVSRLNFRLIGFKPNALLSAIVAYFEQDTETAKISPELTEAVIKWLTISVGNLDDVDLCAKSNRLCLRLAAAYLQPEIYGEVPYPGWSRLAIAMRAILAVLNVEGTKKIESKDQENEARIFLEIVRAFNRSPDLPTDAALRLSPNDVIEPVWAALFADFLKVCVKHRKEIIGEVALSTAEDLFHLLFDRQKRWFVFNLLCMASAMCRPLYNEDYCEVGESTTACQRLWEEDLEQEEKDELDDDIFAVCQWLPRSLMEDLESWDKDDQKECNEEDVVGYMLSWLILLSFVEASASVDVLNRGSFSSYIEKSRSAVFVLSLALDHIDFGQNRQSKRMLVTTIEEMQNDKNKMEISMLAPLVLYRTTEVFPSLMRKWWEEDCPRALMSPLCQFVEANVAPGILRHELDRIKEAPDFDEMNVNGSIVSREVIATYLQDECQLSVTISIPPTFPLRNVEVDSSKTLGVPEKRLKRWTLQIRQMLNTQDGTLKDALMLWKQNVDQEFAGVEPCVICYSVLSVKTHDLPNLECKQCSNVFHSGCLYKWFHSSGRSQCVLCQQPWSGSRIR